MEHNVHELKTFSFRGQIKQSHRHIYNGMVDRIMPISVCSHMPFIPVHLLFHLILEDRLHSRGTLPIPYLCPSQKQNAFHTEDLISRVGVVYDGAIFRPSEYSHTPTFGHKR